MGGFEPIESRSAEDSVVWQRDVDDDIIDHDISFPFYPTRVGNFMVPSGCGDLPPKPTCWSIYSGEWDQLSTFNLSKQFSVMMSAELPQSIRTLLTFEFATFISTTSGSSCGVWTEWTVELSKVIVGQFGRLGCPTSRTW